jgi:hypothetical protein
MFVHGRFLMGKLPVAAYRATETCSEEKFVFMTHEFTTERAGRWFISTALRRLLMKNLVFGQKKMIQYLLIKAGR